MTKNVEPGNTETTTTASGYPNQDLATPAGRIAEAQSNITDALRAFSGLRAIAELLESAGQPCNQRNYDLGDDFTSDLACLLSTVSKAGSDSLSIALEENLDSALHDLRQHKSA